MSALARLRSRVTSPTARADSGTTLAELLVTIMLLGFFLTILVSVVVTMSRNFTEQRAAGDNIRTASLAANELTRIIRSGTETRVSGNPLNNPVFTEVGNERLTVNAFIDTEATNPRPVRVRFYVRTLPDGTRELREQRFDANPASGPYWTFSGSAASDRLLTRHVTATTGTQPWMFRYERADGTAVVPPTASAVITDAATLRQVARVVVTVRVQSDVTSRAVPMVITNEVGIPNLGIDRVGAGA